MPFVCSLFQVSAFSLFPHLIWQTLPYGPLGKVAGVRLRPKHQWCATALGGRAALSRVGSRLQVCLLSLPGVRVLTLPPLDLANLATRSLRLQVSGCARRRLLCTNALALMLLAAVRGRARRSLFTHLLLLLSSTVGVCGGRRCLR